MYRFAQSLLEEAGISEGTLPRSFLKICLNDLQKQQQLVNDLAGKISSLSLEFPLHPRRYPGVRGRPCFHTQGHMKGA